MTTESQYTDTEQISASTIGFLSAQIPQLYNKRTAFMRSLYICRAIFKRNVVFDEKIKTLFFCIN